MKSPSQFYDDIFKRKEIMEQDFRSDSSEKSKLKKENQPMKQDYKDSKFK